MASEIVFLITEQRNKQRITLPAGSYRFGRSAQCEYVLRRNNVGEVQFVVACTKDGWTVTDSSTECATWYDNRYLNQGETCPLQEGDVLGLNTDGNASTQEITFRVEEIRTAQSGETGLRQEQTDNAVLREVDVRRKKRVLIGRGDDCDIKLVSDRVSRHHCEILYKDGHYELHDLGSTNGTYVDGARVTGTVLRSGAVINVPTQVFAFSGGLLHYHEHKSGISVQLLNVYKTVKNRNTGKPLNIVDGTSFEIEPNSFVVLVGGSGTGKSSLLTCITGTAPCTKGSVRFDGLDTADNRNAFEAVLGYVPQKDIMHDNLTVEQSLTFTAKLRIAHDATRAEINAAVAHAIEAVDLTGREKTLISQLSGGQKQRVAMARMIASEPDILLLDEPFSALDSYLKWELEQEMRDMLAEVQKPVLFVSHNRDEVYRLCSVVSCIDHGKMEVIEKTKEFFHNPKTKTAAVLSGCKNISAAEIVDNNHIKALGWGITLCVSEIPEETKAVGIRAHSFYPVNAEQIPGKESAANESRVSVIQKGTGLKKYRNPVQEENIFKIEESRIIEDPFEWNISFRPSKESGWLQWKIAKTEQEDSPGPIPPALAVHAKDILLLKDNAYE